MPSNEFLSQEHIKKCIKELQGQPSLRSSEDKNPSRAAVLVPICQTSKNNPEDPLDRWGLIFTKRSAFLSSHAREICFPGGKCDSPDESFESAALRETHEELGIPSSKFDIWTCMAGISNKRGGSLITPVVGLVDDPNVMSNIRLNPAEVDEVFVKSFRELMDPKITGYTQFRTKGSSGYSIPVYRCEPQAIWGMTAIITFQLMNVLLRGRGYRHKIMFQTPYKTS